MHLYLILFLVSGTVLTTETVQEKKEEELALAESNRKLEIIKKIKKINEDGSYTIGYEADDGSFKIESRDVLGHIKGTYGFVDDDGQIKRVSYSSKNASEVINNPEGPSVVQKIPQRKSTTEYVSTSTPSTPTQAATSHVQSISRRKIDNSTTRKPNYQKVVNISQSITKPNYIAYSSGSPRPPATISNPNPKINTERQEQVAKPEVRITESPSHNLYNEKPVTEEAEYEMRGNILRRQLSHENEKGYNAQEHISRLQQSLGHDVTDVYSNSMTTGTPRPLFTTTHRPKFIQSSTTSTPSVVRRPSTVDIPVSKLDSSPQYNQDSTTVQSESIHYTPTSVPVLQIPANRVDNRVQLLALNSPNQRGTILVPLSQINGRILSREQLENVYRDRDDSQYDHIPEAIRRPNLIEVNQKGASVRKLPSDMLRPMPVQVDENGYIREMHRPVQISYPVSAASTPQFIQSSVDNDIDNIHPPVSTKDFQKLLQLLIMRQSRLEKISALTRQTDIYMQPRLIHPTTDFNSLQREPPRGSNIHFSQERHRNHGQEDVDVEQQHLVPLRNYPSNDLYEEYFNHQSYRPNRRVARLLPSNNPRHLEKQEEYLPSDVREMLLLRMLQLAINPALPVPEEDIKLATRSSTLKTMPVRNVEILGEEESEE